MADKQLAIEDKLREQQSKIEMEKTRIEQEQRRMEEVESAQLNARLMEERLAAVMATVQHDVRRSEEEKLVVAGAGTGSGGYIVLDMPEKDRSLFHDLLKGFEDFAKLKGYTIAFSIDATFGHRIAFKFTVKDEGVVVGPERVRKDFKEYMERVRSEEIDELDNIPVVASIEEHALLVTILKNRISFLRHSYNLSQNAVKFYEGLLGNVRSFPALAAPSVVVQTGGTMETRSHMDSRSYNAANSQNVLQGDNSMLTDNSIRIGKSFNERQERIQAVEDLIEKLRPVGAENEAIARVERELEKVRDELREFEEPNESAIRRWLELAKKTMTGSILGYEIVEAGRRLWELFGI